MGNGVYGLRADPSETLGRLARRVVCNALYYGFARHLPYSVRPYALGARRIRYLLCRQMLASCGENVNIEHGALINSGSQIHVGDNSGIGLDAFVSGPLVIGRNVIMGPNCTFLSINRDTQRTDVPMIDQGYLAPRAPVVEDDVWLGANVTVLPGRRIGQGAIVAAGAVVSRDVPPYAVVAGNPGRVIRIRSGAPAWAR
ncbi:MAG: acyltransferase [Acidimicrobiales bacterium]